MLDLRLLGIRSFMSANTVVGLAMAAMMGGLLLILLFLQGPRGESVLESGLVTFAQALGILLGMPLAARLHVGLGLVHEIDDERRLVIVPRVACRNESTHRQR